MKLARVLAVAVALAGMCVVASGCFRHGYGRNVAPEPIPRYSAWHHYFLWGIISTAPDLDLDAICPEAGPARVQNYFGPVGALVAILTGGLWAPSAVQVWCADGGAPVVIDLETGEPIEPQVADTQQE